MPLPHNGTLTPGEVAALLADARERTLLLIAPLPEDELMNQHNRLMSPVVWDMGHIAHFEELWLVRNLEGPVRFGEMPGMFNPFENPRSVRGELALPRLADTLHHMAGERRMVLDRMMSGDTGSADPRLLEGGYVYRMVAQHEYQHNETILQALQLKDDGARYRAPRAIVPPAGRPVDADYDGMVWFPGGTVQIGTDDRTAAYDNERPRHAVELAPFRIGAAPVTSFEYAQFIHDGGYDTRALWSEAGWKHREEANLGAPQFWEMRDGDWWTRSMDLETPVDPGRPVCHVCWYEAEAYCNWAGARLPTEQEWEAAASWDPATGTKRAYPVGRRRAHAAGRQPGPARLRHRAGGGVPAQRVAHRRVRDDRRRVGVDGVGLRALARLPDVPVSGVQRALLRPGLQGAARRVVGHAPGRHPQHLPQLGLPHPPPDLQRLPDRPR